VNFVAPTYRQLIILLLCGVFGSLGQFCVTAGYSFAPAREISVYDYAQVLFSAMFGYFLFGQKLDVWSGIGYLIIISMRVFALIENKEDRIQNLQK
jgi:drug/metabolite transporter (DMT)-like permease